MNPEEFKKGVKEIQFRGKGSFGKVIEVEYLGKKYALKKISKIEIEMKKAKDREYLKTAINRERQILKKMSEYENSLHFYLYYEDEEYYIFVLELCDKDLSKLLKDRKELPVPKFDSSEILYIMESLNEPLKYMHNNDLIHRDIKSENILIKYLDSSKTKYIPKMADYGASTELVNGIATAKIGSKGYMAPEILTEEDEYNDKSDLYSMGVMIYELYFGEYPFEMAVIGEGLINIQKKLNKKKMKDCEDKVLDDLLNKLLIYDPDKRISWEEYFNHPFFNRNKIVENLNNKLNNMKLYNNAEHQLINLYDFMLENIMAQNNKEKEKIKNSDFKKFSPIDICLKLQNDSFFILGILARYLELIGIKALIDRTSKEKGAELASYHKNIIQFICTSYILKYKYILDFDLNENRIKYLNENPIDRKKFNDKIKNYLMDLYNLNENELLITNHNREKNKFTCELVIKSNFESNLSKEELIKTFEKDEELKTLSNVNKELIIPVIKFSKSMLNPSQDNKTNRWKEGEKRGGEKYLPPIGWINYGINISHNFNDSNDHWISSERKKAEWCVAYCGITGITKKMEQIYENEDDIRHKGKKVGVGVYCFNDPKLLEENTETIKANGENYKVGFMVRVRPDKIRASEKNKKIWILSGNYSDLRPYGILLKQTKK